MSPRRRKDRHEASGFSRRPDPDSDEDEDYERERRKRSKGVVHFIHGGKKRRNMGKFAVLYSSLFSAERCAVSSEPLE